MPSYDDPFELADEYEISLEGRLRRRNGRPLQAGFLIVVFLALAAGIYLSASTVDARLDQDATCLACHTDQHDAYFKRAEAALAGSIALDLSSFHYQQIRGQGGSLNCIDCHRGDGHTLAHLETLGLSARISLVWLLRGEKEGVEAAATAITDTNGIATYIGSAALSAPHLANDSCISCHTSTLLIAGIENHMHNTLPVAYALWKSGAPLTPPKDSTSDAQAVIARGLTSYQTNILCSDCHLTHYSTDAEHYLHQPTMQHACVQCHTDTGIAINNKQ